MSACKDQKIGQDKMELAANIYKLCNELPAEERFGLVQEMTQTALAIAANYANDIELSDSKDDTDYSDIVAGKLARLETQIEIANRLGYLDEDKTNNVFRQIDLVRSQLTELNKDGKTDEATT
jgi:four helix bundle protein